MKDKIDTQGMSMPGKHTSTKRVYPPMPVKKRTIITPEERQELKDLINEVLDERESRDSN
mgnify:FL=1